ncbi:mas-related G-protein coupled receptor member A-like [Heteronotia binoei]|uniref:mas-related G-protein coupled receptor member A-like n=1 Tax=Heteronotia binoei TaxID=13085 RepID=UPI00292E3372|nr:mas-related G-protein coupled receptor member A-like [Heteronotia binoei]
MRKVVVDCPHNKKERLNANFSKTTLSPVEDGPQYDDMHNIGSSGTWMFLIFLPSSLGNGTVIYLFGFQIKRSPFTTYLLNLAFADFGLLLFLDLSFILFLTPFLFMYTASQLLLTSVSIQRCVSVLFPIWYRCRRPQCQSTAACALIWVLSLLPFASLLFLKHFRLRRTVLTIFCLFIAAAILCLSLVTASTLILLFKVFCKSQQPRRGRILTIILLTLLFYLICAFPSNVILSFRFFFFNLENDGLTFYGFLCACLNSCVNPVIYFAVGRKKRGQKRQSLKVILQRAFEEKEEHREDWGTPAQTSV